MGRSEGDIVTRVEKGIVSSTDIKGAKVTIPTRDGYVTESLFVPAHIGGLDVNDIVAFVEFEDLTGVILCRLEG